MKKFSTLFITCIVFIFSTVMLSAHADEKRTAGFDHIGLAVSDLDASATFFVDVLDFKIRGRDKKYPAAFLNNGSMTLTLWQTSDDAVKFDRKNNVGLHHLAIKATSFEALDALYEKMKSMPSVTIEFAPELFYGGPAKHMIFREPSGNRIEVIYRP